MDKSSKYSAQEYLCSHMTFIEQYAESVLEYSSKYNSVMSISYAPENVTGKANRYPNYGDFPDTYILRTYGNWWNNSEFAQNYYMPQDRDAIVSEDFITVGFEFPVFPKNLMFYETFNPGAIVRIWARMTGGPWILLYEAVPDKVLDPEARIFAPKINKIQNTINEIRLELNQSHLKYHTALDAILLVGHKPNSILQMELFKQGIFGLPPQSTVKLRTNITEDSNSANSIDYVSQLPYEVLINVFSYLDLKSLSCCARVTKTWNQATKDSSLYSEITLKKYWSRVTNETLNCLTKRCTRLKKLDISWCINGYVTEENFVLFLKNCGKQLTHLSCQFCKFVKNDAIKQIAEHTNLIELRLRTCYPLNIDYTPLAKLKKLECLDLCSTNIDDKQLILILKENPNLKHLNIDFCEEIMRLEVVAEVVATYNKEIVTWSSWKTHSMTSLGVMYLARCKNLRELDLGWCLVLSHPDHCLEKIAQGCPNLKRLILSGWRGVSDNLLVPIVQNCKKLEQIDLLGIKNITGEVCEMALSTLQNISLLDISFCDSIEEDKVRMWKSYFTSVAIQRSCDDGNQSDLV